MHYSGFFLIFSRVASHSEMLCDVLKKPVNAGPFKFHIIVFCWQREQTSLIGIRKFGGLILGSEN
jgi:hypothetical protein